jgi:hypothetical protein
MEVYCLMEGWDQNQSIDRTTFPLQSLGREVYQEYIECSVKLTFYIKLHCYTHVGHTLGVFSCAIHFSVLHICIFFMVHM